MLKWRLLLFIIAAMKISKSSLQEAFGIEKGGDLSGLFSRRVISDRQKVLCTVACLQAVGDDTALTEMLNLALSDPGALIPLYEVLLQGHLFCGYPRAIESFFCLHKAARQRGVALDEIVPVPLEGSQVLMDRGIAAAGAVHRGKLGQIRNKINAISPDLGYLMIAEGYGHILCRPGLDLPARELAVVACLTGLGAMRQLNSHIRGSLNVGCSAAQVFEAILMTSPWLVIDKVRGAAEVWASITGEDINTLGSAYNYI